MVLMVNTILMSFKGQLNGKSTKALVGMGATYHLLFVAKARWMGLLVEQGNMLIKIVNTKSKPFHVVDWKVEIRLGSWMEWVDFSIVPMDHYNFMLRIDFMHAQDVCLPNFLKWCNMHHGALHSLHGSNHDILKKAKTWQLLAMKNN